MAVHHLLIQNLQTLEILRKLIQSIQRLHKMPKPNLLPTRNSQRMRRPRSILDLPAIHIPRRQVPDLLRRDIVGCANLGNKRSPDLFLGGLRKLLEVQGYMNTREEGLIEDLDAVGGQEENSAIIFNMAKAI